MIHRIEVSESENIPRLVDYLHNRLYNLSRIEHCVRGRWLKIMTDVPDTNSALEQKKLLTTRWTYDVYGAILTVGNVINYSVEDKDEIDQSDISTIEYEDGFIYIKGSVPVIIKIKVSSLYMDLKIADEPCRKEQLVEFLGITWNARFLK